MPNPLVLLYGPERDSTQIRFDLKGSRHSVLREHEGINLPPPPPPLLHPPILQRDLIYVCTPLFPATHWRTYN